MTHKLAPFREALLQAMKEIAQKLVPKKHRKKAYESWEERRERESAEDFKQEWPESGVNPYEKI